MLAKSVIEAILVYPMMINMLPKACVDDIQRLQRNFVYEDSSEKRSYHAMD